MVSESVQDYCDWCFGALTDPARARSRWLGLAAEDAWACADCLAAGRYRVPPDGWAGPEEEWLARDEYVLRADDLTVIVNALNEVLHGPDAVEEWEFQTRLGVTRAEALQTMRRIGGRGIA
ncbi:hypothetical protein J1G42_14275 [Cellulomonas sp. zg-ZUI222]|uniref:hypothetical protein n=1 Tax=Cellulomonas wangleii TaxID=2816956 RepID=UPI001A9486EB|nr:hypothetical protein [Cellulomonas wangleii]MBO0921988.1 hypothetical protein [Cellulomonas wangleii]